jgi:multidrug efflux pump subunit AcrA (membrane-fusion protein)
MRPTSTKRCTEDFSPIGKSLLLWLALFLLPFSAFAKSFSGLVYPQHDVTLSAGVSGLVMKRLVVPGQSVKVNQVLLQLDDRMQVIESDRRRVIFQDQRIQCGPREIAHTRDTARGCADRIQKNRIDQQG